MKNIDFYFDFSCPWSYIALVRLQDVAERNGASITCKPVTVAQVLATENPAAAGSRWSANPAKAAWEKQDLQTWARFWGLRIELGERWPLARTAAGRAALAASEAGQGLNFSLAVLRAAFGQGADIDDAAVLADIAGQTGLIPDIVSLAASDGSRDSQLEANSLELIRRGGFGTPSMFVDDTLYFGNDRIPLIEWILGPISRDDFIMPGQHNTY